MKQNTVVHALKWMKAVRKGIKEVLKADQSGSK